MNMLAPKGLLRDTALAPGEAPLSCHLVAVNCHPFHAPEDLMRCLRSLVPAMVAFRRAQPGPVSVRIFWHRPDDPPPALRLIAARAGLTLCRLPHKSNGANLNAQIEFALRCGYDTFFRVDADDTVRADRFPAQAALLAAGTCDLVGCALRYCQDGTTPYLTRVAEHPGPRDFVENRFLLHPTLAIRLAALAETNLRYGCARLEDKEFLLKAHKLGLRVRNLDVIGGDYFIGRGTRATLSAAWRGLRLNLACIAAHREVGLLPYAVALFAARVVIGPALLRRWRAGARRRGARNKSGKFG